MKTVALFLILTLAIAINAWAKISDHIEFEAGEVSGIEAGFFHELDDGVLRKYTPVDAYLIASGLTDETSEGLYRSKFDALRNRARAELAKDSSDPYVLAKALLFWLHDNVFKQYVLTSAEADKLLDGGYYNCLSSSIAYMIFAQDLGLSVKGVIAKDHALCMLTDKRGDKDIETTIRYGFDPGVKEIEQFEKMTNFVYVQKLNYLERRTVGIFPMIGAVYSNKAFLTDDAADEWKENMTRYKKGYYFDPDSFLFKTNIIAGLNNGAVDEMNRGSFEKAFDLIRQGKKFAPDALEFNTLEVQYYDTLAHKAFEGGDFAGAVKLVKQGIAARPDSAVLKNNLISYYTSWANLLADNKKYDEAVSVLQSAMLGAPGDEMIRDDMKTIIYNQVVDEYNLGNYKRAIALTDEGLKMFPGDRDLSELKKSIPARGESSQ